MAFTTLLDIETGKTSLVDVDVASSVSGVASVNGYTGTVVLSGADINATVDGGTDTINNQFSGLLQKYTWISTQTESIRNDLDDLGDQVQGIEAKMPSAPSTDGTYKLTCTVTDGVASYSWVAE